MLSKKDLWKLRSEIVLNSLYIADYENSFDIPAEDVCDFFDGYVEELYYIMLEEIGEDKVKELSDKEYYKELFKRDNIDNLYNYYYGIENNSF